MVEPKNKVATRIAAVNLLFNTKISFFMLDVCGDSLTAGIKAIFKSAIRSALYECPNGSDLFPSGIQFVLRNKNYTTMRDTLISRFMGGKHTSSLQL